MAQHRPPPAQGPPGQPGYPGATGPPGLPVSTAGSQAACASPQPPRVSPRPSLVLTGAPPFCWSKQLGDPSGHRAPCPCRAHPCPIHPLPRIPSALSICLLTPSVPHPSVPHACLVRAPFYPIHAPSGPPSPIHAPCPICAPRPSSSPVLRGAFISFLPQGIKGERGYVGPPGEKGELVSPSGPCSRGRGAGGSPKCPPSPWLLGFEVLPATSI